MKTLAVTFGNDYMQTIAESFARRFSAINGIEAIAIDPLEAPLLDDPSWIKAWLWDLVPKDVERLIWFDADNVPIAPVIDLLPSYPYPFSAVLDFPDMVTRALRACPAAKACQYYFNAGFFVAHRSIRPVFEEWRKLMDENLGFMDQTALNVTLNKHYKANDLSYLSRITNWLGAFGKVPENVRMLHLAGWSDQDQRTQMLRAFSYIFDQGVKVVSPGEEALCCVS